MAGGSGRNNGKTGNTERPVSTHPPRSKNTAATPNSISGATKSQAVDTDRNKRASTRSNNNGNQNPVRHSSQLPSNTMDAGIYDHEESVKCPDQVL